MQRGRMMLMALLPLLKPGISWKIPSLLWLWLLHSRVSKILHICFEPCRSRVLLMQSQEGGLGKLNSEIARRKVLPFSWNDNLRLKVQYLAPRNGPGTRVQYLTLRELALISVECFLKLQLREGIAAERSRGHMIDANVLWFSDRQHIHTYSVIQRLTLKMHDGAKFRYSLKQIQVPCWEILHVGKIPRP